MSSENDNDVVNQSHNRPFEDVMQARFSRRAATKGGLAAMATTFVATNKASARHGWANKAPLIGFTPVAVEDGGGAEPSISPEYEYQVLLPWGDPIVPSGPAYSYPPSAEDQAKQVGIGHDGMTFFPNRGKGHWWWWKSNRKGLLCLNNEFGGNQHVLGKTAPESLEDVRVSQHAHGVTIVAIEQVGETWQRVESDKARRIHVNTPVTFSGPVAGHHLLQTEAGNEPAGTVNNCSNGQTPWGTYLTCEENFNGYFGATGDWTPTPAQERYGFSAGGFGYGWEKFDQRFDLSNDQYFKEDNRFGWVVEIDPQRPNDEPVKRTALGRFKHEGVAIGIGRGGRVVAYMGDDQRFDYIYKFVSDGNWRAMRARGLSPLDHGKLYVARFNDDGTGDWLELSIDNPALAAEFTDQQEVLTYARMAADLLGATPMDRPEWTTIAPNGEIYCTLTNNSRRTEADAANPMAPNADGHIIKFRDTDRHVGTSFTWDIFLVAQDTHGTEDTFSDPDGIWADPDGRLFIQTDGGQPDGLNNQILVADTRTGEIRRLFTGVAKDEITGIAITPDRRTMFINTQHPGNGDPALTNFPAPTDGTTIPRDSTIVIRRKDGGIIGS